MMTIVEIGELMQTRAELLAARVELRALLDDAFRAGYDAGWAYGMPPAMTESRDMMRARALAEWMAKRDGGEG